jgi:hypothetical protein
MTLFLKRMEWHFPRTAFGWRLEFQERGAPHVHVLMFFDKRHRAGHFMGKGWCLVRYHWADILRKAGLLCEATELLLRHNEGLTNGKWLRHMRQITSYVSKYMAKVEKQAAAVESPHAGEPVGCAGGDSWAWGVGFGTPAPLVLDNGTYLEIENATTGRVWGFWHAELIPWGELISFVAEFGRGFYALRRVCRRFWRFLPCRDGPASEHAPSGWTIFSHSQDGVYRIGVFAAQVFA